MQIQGETFKVQAKDRGGDLENLGRTKRLPWSLFPAKSLGNIPRVEECVSRPEKVFTGEEAFSISPGKIRSGNFLSSSKLLPKGIFNPFRKLRPKNWHLNTGDRILFGEGKKVFQTRTLPDTFFLSKGQHNSNFPGREKSQLVFRLFCPF